MHCLSLAVSGVEREAILSSLPRLLVFLGNVPIMCVFVSVFDTANIVHIGSFLLQIIILFMPSNLKSLVLFFLNKILYFSVLHSLSVLTEAGT